jgi:iron complex outermembrane receptor protein
MKNFFTKKLLTVFFIIVSVKAFGQTVKGKVVGPDGEPLPGVNIVEKSTSNGTATDFDGNYSINLKKSPSVLVFSSVGFQQIEKDVSSGTVNITMQEGNVLDEVVLTGSRAKPRTILDSPVPIDNIGVRELQSTGQNNIDQMLTYAVPSYNSSNQTISDATAHFDPADLRGLGPSRTLVLVNGKRKNQSALVYVNDTPGKGEVGTDMKSIPTAAIERVEVLRDGASAQYGSDAVAGVVNIILKKDIDHTEVNVSSGVTKEGDGFNAGADVNHTFSIGDGGFFNATLSGYHQDYTDRAGEPGKDDLFGVDNEWTRENPDLGMIVGQPQMTKGDLYVNAEYPLSDDTKLYAFGGFDYRKGKSFALYRTPYWVPDPFNLLHDAGTEYQGFQPTFETDIQDILFTAGAKFKLGEFNSDLSATYGGNTVDYTIGNTLNQSLGASSPTSFDAGAYAFSNIIGNFDVNRSFGDVSVGFGVEARLERFKVEAGEEASYIQGPEVDINGDPLPSGAQSFPGLQPSNALNETRTNIGGYGTLDWDVTENFLLGGAIRYENYSDFGDNFSWKVNSRLKIGEAGVLRASYSTGFRAPSLHQVYLSNVQTLVSGGTISNQGTFNNVDPVIRDLGVKPLFAETSDNISAGLTVKASSDFTISLDYYNVKVDDRVLFSGEIGGTDDNGNPNAEVQAILDANQVTSIKFFINAVNTITQGFDYTMRYKNIDFAAGKLALNLALNINKTELDGEVETPESLANYKNKIFNRKEQSRIVSARPNTKLLVGANYEIGKFSAGLNNTYFGEVTWQHADDPGKDQTFSGKVVTDLSLGYEFSDAISLNVIVNNLFDVYPDEIDTKGDEITDLGGRFRYPWEVNQFGFNGMTFKAGLNFKF